MQRLRSFFDTDHAEKFSSPTNYLTTLNQNEMNCSVCGERFYVNDLLFEQIRRSIEETSENPFICEDCAAEFGEFANAA